MMALKVQMKVAIIMLLLSLMAKNFCTIWGIPNGPMLVKAMMGIRPVHALSPAMEKEVSAGFI